MSLKITRCSEKSLGVTPVLCDEPRFWWLVSSFFIGCHGYVSGEAISPTVWVNDPDSPAANTAFVANSRFVPASLPVGHQSSESSET